MGKSKDPFHRSQEARECRTYSDELWIRFRLRVRAVRSTFATAACIHVYLQYTRTCSTLATGYTVYKRARGEFFRALVYTHKKMFYVIAIATTERRSQNS